MAATITEISIRGYKSIERLDRLALRPLNVLVGANGAGKSNLLNLISLLTAIVNRHLQRASQVEGGADALLHLGSRVTRELLMRIVLAGDEFEIGLVPTTDDRLIVGHEEIREWGGGHEAVISTGGSTNQESGLRSFGTSSDDPLFPPWNAARRVVRFLASITPYHFEDTSSVAGVRRRGGINDDEHLRPDASNLAAFLHRIRVTHPDHLRKIRDVVRLAAPFFDDFKLRPIPTNPDMIQLEWTQQGTDYPFRPSQLSDGTLRFICLATALLQPDPPAVMMFDEPELGLHPYALTLLATLFHEAADGPAQVIVSTQSATLLNEFDAEDVVVVERANGASTFRRLDPAALSEWLADYAVGDLWQKNLFGGRPRPETGGAR